MLFYSCKEMLWHGVTGKYNRLSAQSARFGSTNVKDITKLCDILQSYICFLAYQSVDQSCSVHIKWEFEFTACS